MPNKTGNAYGLTVLFPIKSGLVANYDHKEALRIFLADLPRDETSPFARSAITHFSRMVVVEKFGYNGEPSLVDDLKSPYLLWTACFNGDLEPWLDLIWTDMSAELKTILGHCVAYENYFGQQGFKNYVNRCQIETSFLFADYPDDTLEEVLEGLKLKKHFVDFMVDNQQSNAETLKSNFMQWMETMDNTPSPTPGSTY